jgi:hypothetical protein
MPKGIKHPSPFKIKMGFGEVLERFIQTKPSELEAVIKRSKSKKPPWQQEVKTVQRMAPMRPICSRLREVARPDFRTQI